MNKTLSKKYLEVAEGTVTHVKVEVYYSMGGMNYFTGTNEARGIKISVSPVTRNTSGIMVSESYVGFSGSKRHLKDMARYSAKTCDNFVVDKEVEKSLIEYVCKQNNIKLKENLEEVK